MLCRDDNIDNFHLSNQPMANTLTSLHKNLFAKLSEQLEDINFVIMNFDPTFGIVRDNPSTIDHLYTNCPPENYERTNP